MPGVDDLADELYALPPGQFVEARGAVVAAARAAGDAATASALAKLRKPTVAAWLVNRVVRDEPDLVAGVVAIGPALREATVAGDGAALRDLTRHRKVLLAQLVSAARGIARDAEQAFTATTQRELEATFTAAASDPDAAEAVGSGRLTATLSFAGLGFEVGGIPPERAAAPVERPREAAPAAGPRAPRRTTANQPAPAPSAADLAREQRVVEAEQALAVARLQEADAVAALEAAQAALQTATEAEKQAAAAHREAKAAVSDARADLTASKSDAATAQKAVADALAALERARSSG